MKNREIRSQRRVTQEVIRPGVDTTIISCRGGELKRQVCRDQIEICHEVAEMLQWYAWTRKSTFKSPAIRR